METIYPRKNIKPVFDKAVECGLNLWDTAVVYREGSSERILGNFVKEMSREKVILFTKFTPRIASNSLNEMQKISLLHHSSERVGIFDYCKENGIVFYFYMVLEQGALTGRYNETNPFPEGTVPIIGVIKVSQVEEAAGEEAEFDF